MAKKRLITTFLAAFFLLLATPIIFAEQPDFSGTWKLDPDRSDAPQPQRGGGGGRGGGRGGEAPRGGGGGGGGAPRGGGGGQPGGTTLTIGQTEVGINVVEAGRGGMEYLLVPGEDAQEIETQRGAAKVKASWKGEILIVEMEQEMQTPRGNMKLSQKQHWSLQDGGTTLVRDIEAENPRGSRKFKQIFTKSE